MERPFAGGSPDVLVVNGTSGDRVRADDDLVGTGRPGEVISARAGVAADSPAGP